MASLRYYHSDLIHFTGELRNIPKTVVGLDTNNLNRFLTYWIREPELAQKQFGGLMLKQMKVQCQALAKVAGLKHPQTRDAYRRAETIIRMLLDNEYRGIETPEDRFSQHIEAYCSKLV